MDSMQNCIKFKQKSLPDLSWLLWICNNLSEEECSYSCLCLQHYKKIVTFSDKNHAHPKS